MQKPAWCTLLLLMWLALSGRGVALAEPAAPAAFSRAAMLGDLARRVLAPGAQDLAQRCRALTNSIGRLLDQPSEQALEAARQAWLEVAQAAFRMKCFQAGPLVDRESIPTFFYWQVLPPRIQEVLNGTGPVDQAYLDQLGAPAKGLFTIEYLLFERKSETTNSSLPLALETLSGPGAARYGAYLLALAQELEGKARLMAADWSAPEPQGAAQKFAAGGQESLNLLVNRLAAGLEETAERHLHFVLVLPAPIMLSRVERSRSASSLAGVLACLEGAQALYQGGGGLALRDAVQAVNPALATRLQEQFEASLRAARAIGAPLEVAAVQNRPALEKAYEETRKLEVMLKVDLVSALGVTLTFSSNDGD